MPSTILSGLLRRYGLEKAFETLSRQLPLTQLNTLLMELFAARAAQIRPAGLLAAYRQNRFVQPAAIDPVAFRELELKCLKAAQTAGFTPLELAPVSPLGTCSVVGTVHQNKVLSALRSTEVVADATNALALESAHIRQAGGFPEQALHFSTVHRHLRTPAVEIPGFSAHFKILGLTSAGRDTGSVQFERENLRRHIVFYDTLLRGTLGLKKISFLLKALDPPGGQNLVFEKVHAFLRTELPALPIEIVRMPQTQQAYYRSLQFGILWEHNGQSYPIGDGGFTDWTQQLGGSRKERFLISAIGIEFMYKLLRNNRVVVV